MDKEMEMEIDLVNTIVPSKVDIIYEGIESVDIEEDKYIKKFIDLLEKDYAPYPYDFYLQDILSLYQYSVNNKLITIMGEAHGLKIECKEGKNVIDIGDYVLSIVNSNKHSKILLEYNKKPGNQPTFYNINKIYDKLNEHGFSDRIKGVDFRSRFFTEEKQGILYGSQLILESCVVIYNNYITPLKGFLSNIDTPGNPFYLNPEYYNEGERSYLILYLKEIDKGINNAIAYINQCRNITANSTLTLNLFNATKIQIEQFYNRNKIHKSIIENLKNKLEEIYKIKKEVVDILKYEWIRIVDFYILKEVFKKYEVDNVDEIFILIGETHRQNLENVLKPFKFTGVEDYLTLCIPLRNTYIRYPPLIFS